MKWASPLLRACRRLSAFLLATALATPAWSSEDSAVVCEAIKVADRLLRGEEPFNAALGASALLKYGNQKAALLLFDQLDSDNDILRRVAVDTLISVETAETAHMLREIAKVDPEWSKLIAVGLLAVPRFGLHQLLSSIVFGDEYKHKERARAHALRALSVRHHPISEEQLSLLISADSSMMLRQTASYAALRQGVLSELAFRTLLRAVQQGDADGKEMAAVAFAYVDSENARETLERLGRHEDPRISVAALVSLAAQGSGKAEKSVGELILGGHPLDASLAAAGLKRLPEDVAYRITRRVFDAKNPSTEAVLRMIESWVWFEGDRVGQVIAWGLAHPDKNVVLQSVWLAGWRPQSEFNGRLAKLLRDPDPAMRGMSAWSIVRTHRGQPGCVRDFAGI